MVHSDYVEHVYGHIAKRFDDVEFMKSVVRDEEIIGIILNLNLDRAKEILETLYCPKPGNEPRDPLCMLRSLIVMTLKKITSIDVWVSEIKGASLLAILGIVPK